MIGKRDRRGLLGVLAGALLLLGGCLAQEDRGVGRSFPEEDQPECYERARFLEERALKAIRSANKNTWSDRRRRELYDDALIDLRDARDMYHEELLEQPKPPGRDVTTLDHEDPGHAGRLEILEQEFERLNDLIEATERERPAG